MIKHLKEYDSEFRNLTDHVMKFPKFRELATKVFLSTRSYINSVWYEMMKEYDPNTAKEFMDVYERMTNIRQYLMYNSNSKVEDDGVIRVDNFFEWFNIISSKFYENDTSFVTVYDKVVDYSGECVTDDDEFGQLTFESDPILHIIVQYLSHRGRVSKFPTFENNTSESHTKLRESSFEAIKKRLEYNETSLKKGHKSAIFRKKVFTIENGYTDEKIKSVIAELSNFEHLIGLFIDIIRSNSFVKMCRRFNKMVVFEGVDGVGKSSLTTPMFEIFKNIAAYTDRGEKWNRFDNTGVKNVVALPVGIDVPKFHKICNGNVLAFQSIMSMSTNFNKRRIEEALEVNGLLVLDRSQVSTYVYGLLNDISQDEMDYLQKVVEHTATAKIDPRIGVHLIHLVRDNVDNKEGNKDDYEKQLNFDRLSFLYHDYIEKVSEHGYIFNDYELIHEFNIDKNIEICKNHKTENIFDNFTDEELEHINKESFLEEMVKSASINCNVIDIFCEIEAETIMYEELISEDKNQSGSNREELLNKIRESLKSRIDTEVIQ